MMRQFRQEIKGQGHGANTIDKTTVSLSPTELTCIAGFLDASKGLIDHGKEFLCLPATDENRAIFIAVFEHHEDTNPDDEHDFCILESKIPIEGAFIFEISIYSDWAITYFAHRCRMLANSSTTKAFSLPELSALSALLDAGWKKKWETKRY